MIRFQGVETVPGHARSAVFAAGMIKANWPRAVGVRIGPDADVLVDGGRVRAELQLPGLALALIGTVTSFEPGNRIEASGTHAGLWAAMDVLMSDDAADCYDGAEVATTATWRFEARLPFWLAMFEPPAAAAIKVAIPVLSERFIANILRSLDKTDPVRANVRNGPDQHRRRTRRRDARPT